MSIKYYYSEFDLIIQSDLLLPNLQPVATTNKIDVTISYGVVEKQGLQRPIQQSFAYQASPTEFWLNIPFIARFLVSDGRRIIISSHDGVAEESFHAFLLSTCMEVLLRQRQIIVMPGFAVKLGEFGVSFLGGTGLGQSMLQGLFYKRGYPFLASNFVVINDQGNILPGVAQIEFWPAVVSALKLDSAVNKTLRPTIKKSVIPLEQNYYSAPHPLHFIYILKMHQHNEITFSSIENSEKQAYIQQIVAVNHLPIQLWYKNNNCLPNSDVFSKVDIICIHLPTTGLKLQQIADSILNDLTERGHYHAQL